MRRESAGWTGTSNAKDNATRLWVAVWLGVVLVVRWRSGRRWRRGGGMGGPGGGGGGFGGPGGGGNGRYNLTFSLNFNNILNHTNLGNPIGNLGSPLFGQSTSTSGGFGGFGGGNPGLQPPYRRAVEIQLLNPVESF